MASPLQEADDGRMMFLLFKPAVTTCMKYTPFISLMIFTLIFWGCNGYQTQEEPVEKQIEVQFNPNIHTSHIIELFVWPGEYPTRPLVVEAQRYFEPFKNHRAIQLSDSLLQNEIFYFDELTEILLYAEPFPASGFTHSLDHSPYADRETIITEWVEALATFYVDADVASFLEKHQSFYEGARQEVLKNLPPDDFVQLIEAYYRESKLTYTIIPSPEMPTGGAYGYRGIGPYVYTPDGMHIYQVISASLPVEQDTLTGTYPVFGFDNKEFILRNSYHEFGHAFVNTVLDTEPNLEAVNAYTHLFTPGLKEIMMKQNYGNWFDCIAEHLVRLGEIRLAERSGNAAWANELRAYHTDKLQFIFLPEFERKILEFEQDTSIQSFEAFIPELMMSLNPVTSDEVETRIQR
ncbi:MAG: DUF4932 domain-containing protein [Bacteroidota bacterium]